MDEHDFLAEQFEENRAHLKAVAYRMLGSISEAEDAVQETWLRLSRSDTSSVENLGGWLTTVVGRVCLDMLRSRRSRRDGPLGVQVPDRIVSYGDGIDPEREALLADSVGLALLVVLDTLNPAERLAFVLHDMFGVPFEEIAPIVGRSPSAARQLASRARRRVQGATNVPDTDLTRQREVVDAFLAAARRRLRRACGGARPRRCPPSRPQCRACGRIEGGPWWPSCGQDGGQGASPGRTTGPCQRNRGSRRGSAWTAPYGIRLHDQGPEHRRDRRDR
jgi:RNA polymerase sigma factor (sigma-70 family)